MHGYATFNMLVPGYRIAAVTRCVVPRTSIVRENCVRETSVKRQNKIVQHIPRDLANVNALKPCLIPIMRKGVFGTYVNSNDSNLTLNLKMVFAMLP